MTKTLEFTLARHALKTVLFAMTGLETATLARTLSLWAFMTPLDVLVPLPPQLGEITQVLMGYATHSSMDATKSPKNHLAGMMSLLPSQALIVHSPHLLVSMTLGTIFVHPVQILRINVLTRP